MTYQKILIAVDSSARSMSTAKAGFELACLLHAHIGLVYVIDRSKETINADLGITPEESQTVLIKQAQETLAQLIGLYARTSTSDLPVYRFMPEGFPKKEILHTAREWDADMIILGAGCQTTLNRLLNGNLVQYVIKHSPKPVVVIN